MSIRSSSPDEWALHRRDFLMFGSAAVLGAAATSVTAAATLRVVAAPEAGAVLSVGFSEHTAPVAADDEHVLSSVIPAESLRVSDGSFRHSGVRVLVHGFSAPRPAAPVSVRLSTFAPVGETAVPFLAWAHSASASSPRISFLASLDENGTLPVAIERCEPVTRWNRMFAVAEPANTLPDLASLERSGNVCRLSSGDRGDVRLRPGTYFIALRRTASDRRPDWSSIAIDATAADFSGALRRNGAPVDFEYVAVTVTNPVA
jgi:hypothetical protein